MQDSIKKIIEEQEKLRRTTAPFEEIFRLSKEMTGAIGLAGIYSSSNSISAILEANEKYKKVIYGPSLDQILFSPSFEEQLKQVSPHYLNEMHRAAFSETDLDFLRQAERVSEIVRAHDALFSLPKFNDITHLVQETLRLSNSYENLIGRHDAITKLQLAMQSMGNPWLNTSHPERSAHGLAGIFALGEGLAHQLPFSPDFSDLLRTSLGDWRDSVPPPHELLVNPLQRIELYRERGFDQDLTDFTVQAFDESTKRAGLWPANIDDENEHSLYGSEDGLSRAQQAYVKLQNFEIQIRKFIVRIMLEVFGEKWMEQQLPNSMLQQWKDKRKRAIEAGQPPHDLIHYADFSDYKSIIERKDNWNQAFKPIFKRCDDVCESFLRIFPVRIATMHSRIVTLDDELLLLVETKRILKAIQGR